MEQDKKLIFTVMVTFPDLLQKTIEDYNKLYNTDFEIIEVIDDEVPFCKVEAKRYNQEDIFGLGYCLALLQYTLRQKGEISW